jgi:ectoine hydroxylase-related dioxygenase (phytanoyl-CoA dioxygenase family)
MVVDDMNTGVRKRLVDVTPGERAHRFKLNDLYLVSDPIRDLTLDADLVKILASLMGTEPVQCNSLSFEHGSAQPEHIDSLYMPPRTPGRLLATWIALEDVRPQAGPLFYYPGSHEIPPYRFSDGSHLARASEMESWSSYIRAEIAKRALPRETFAARRGDVFIWSANLVHGGSLIENPHSTRRSLVSHYFGLLDCLGVGWKLIRMNGGFWAQRSPQPAP